jgi:hypothetical protein
MQNHILTSMWLHSLLPIQNFPLSSINHPLSQADYHSFKLSNKSPFAIATQSLRPKLSSFTQSTTRRCYYFTRRPPTLRTFSIGHPQPSMLYKTSVEIFHSQKFISSIASNLRSLQPCLRTTIKHPQLQLNLRHLKRHKVPTEAKFSLQSK